MNDKSEVKGKPTHGQGAARLIDMADPAPGEDPNEFQGHRHGAGVSFIVVDAPPGGGPRLHKHPYEEVFVVQEGTATFTAGGETIEVEGGQIVVVPAGVPHRFVNSGRGGCGRWTYTPATGSSPSGSKTDRRTPRPAGRADLFLRASGYDLFVSGL